MAGNGLDMEFQLPAELKSLPELQLLDGKLSPADVIKIGRDKIKEMIDKQNSEKAEKIKAATEMEDKKKLARWLVVGITDLGYWLPKSPYNKIVDDKVVTLLHKGYGVSFKRKYRDGSISKKTTYLPLSI